MDIKAYAYTARADVAKVFSRHTIKAGYEFRKLMLNFTQYNSPSGAYSFGNSPTVRVVNNTTVPTEGFGFAYQFTPKTVFRGAYGIMYSGSAITAAGTSGSSGVIGFERRHSG